MRRVLRPVLVFLAIIFLIEAWLWDRLEPVVARVIAIIPLARLKAELARRIDKLPPLGTLVLLVLPAGAVLPLKMLAFWLMATGAWIEGVGVFVFAKLGAIGTTAFVFEAGRDKLLSSPGFTRFITM